MLIEVNLILSRHIADFRPHKHHLNLDLPPQNEHIFTQSAVRHSQLDPSSYGLRDFDHIHRAYAGAGPGESNVGQNSARRLTSFHPTRPTFRDRALAQSSGGSRREHSTALADTRHSDLLQRRQTTPGEGGGRCDAQCGGGCQASGGGVPWACPPLPGPPPHHQDHHDAEGNAAADKAADAKFITMPAAAPQRVLPDPFVARRACAKTRTAPSIVGLYYHPHVKRKMHFRCMSTYQVVTPDLSLLPS
jgi:hypothetical protein